MDTDPTPSGGRDDARVAAVRHMFRNQIQAMTSLVGLFGRKMAPGEGRDAFTELRARFEAATFSPADDAVVDDEGRFEADLAETARRVAAHLDPDFRHRIEIRGEPVLASPRRASALAQILAELVIDLVRNGFAGGGRGAADISIATTPDGGLSITATQTGPQDATPRRERSDLGLSMLDSLARSLGGAVSRADRGPLSSEVTIPAEHTRR